jgi:hypothetical protein
VVNKAINKSSWFLQIADDVQPEVFALKTPS